MNANEFGLVANGSSGRWYIDIDESLGDVEQFYAQVKGPGLDLNFVLSNPAVVLEAARLLENCTTGKNGASGTALDESLVQLGHFGRAAATLIQDDEFPDRCVLLIGSSSKASMRFTFSGADVRQILTALGHVIVDLREAGLLAKAATTRSRPGRSPARSSR